MNESNEHYSNHHSSIRGSTERCLMAMVPAVLFFAGMIWFATRDKPVTVDPEDEKPAHEAAQEKYDQRPSSYVKVYSIPGFNYCVYRISTPDGDAKPDYDGQDRLFFIAEKTEPAGSAGDENSAMTNILETSAGPAIYQTLEQAKAALDSLHEGMQNQMSGSQVTYESTSTEDVTSTQVGTSAEAPQGTIEAEGLEEGATMDELDIELYDGDGSLIDTYNVTDQAGTVKTTTDLGGYL